MRLNDRRYRYPDSVVREIRRRCSSGECKAAVWRDLQARGVKISLPTVLAVAAGRIRKEV